MEKIIIDTDPGVDDTMAILLANSAENVSIEAVTTVDGNVGIKSVTQNALNILKLCQREDIPVYQGAEKPLNRIQEYSDDFHGSDGLGGVKLLDSMKKAEQEDASDFLIRYISENKGEITITAIGPLTNIAIAVKKDPEFARNTKKLVIMGGAEAGGNMSPVAEFNFYHDPLAAKTVFEAGFKEVVMIGLDATRKVMMTPAMREMLYLIGTEKSRFVYDISRMYTDRKWEVSKFMGCMMCDPLTIAYLINPSVVELKDAYVSIVTEGICEGMSVVYRTERYGDKIPNCKVATNADSKLFFEVYFNTQFEEYKKYVNEMLEHEYR